MTKTVKIVIHVPSPHSTELIQAMGAAGAGKIGNYSHCSFRSSGRGTFLPLKGANPAIGNVGEFEEVIEDRIEMTCDVDILSDVITAIRTAHPYEEPTYDIYERIDYE